jgi:hypothetical protein
MPDDMSHDVDSTSPTLLIATPTHDSRLHHGYVDAARAAAPILEYALADLRRNMEKAELLHGDASREMHKLCYPEQYRDGVRIA